MQDAKWEGANRHPQSKSSKERNERLYNLVIDYEKRYTITLLKDIAKILHSSYYFQLSLLFTHNFQYYIN